MKRLLLLAFPALSISLAAQSSFLVTDPNTGSAASSHYYFYVGAGDPTFTYEFPLTNVSSASKGVKVKKTVLQNPSGQDIYFCFGSNCYTPATFYSAPVTLNAGQSLPYTQMGVTYYGVRTDFDANGVLGLSVVRYTVYDTLNHADSVNITISYEVTPTGIKAASRPAFVANATPNPASSAVTFNYDLNGATNASLKIYNSLGNVVKTVALSPGAKNVQLDVSSLAEGFYFYSLVADGQAVSTRRLVITR